MKVRCPFVKLHQRTIDSLNLYAPTALYPYVGGSDYSYLTFFKQMWVQGEATLIVEHDIEIHAQVLSEAQSCECDWATWPFGRLLPGPHATWDGQGWSAGIPLLTKSLGCVRFSARLMREHPDLMIEVGESSPGGLAPGHWSRLDDAIAQALTKRGVSVHVHTPEVKHHHHLIDRGWDVCSCGDPSCRP